MRVKVRQSVMSFLTAMAVGRAKGIFHHPRAIVNAMDEMMGEKQRQRAEYARLVNCAQTGLNVDNRQGTILLCQCLEHEQTVGRRADVTLQKQRFQRFFHCVMMKGG